jgi:hypothetical protein
VVFNDSVNIGGVVFNVGVGGVHSADEASVCEADENYRLLDLDRTSFYPALIVDRRFVLRHLPTAACNRNVPPLPVPIV